MKDLLEWSLDGALDPWSCFNFKYWTARRNNKLVCFNVPVITNQSNITKITFRLKLLPTMFRYIIEGGELALPVPGIIATICY